MNLRTGALCAAAVAALLAAAPPNEPGRQWWSHIEALASDAMEGRDTGSPGHRRAADYVAGQFERAGLRAAGVQGYIQPVAFEVRKLVEAESSLEIVRDGKARPLTLGEEAIIGLRAAPAEGVEAPLYFAGYGFAVPELNYDDLAGDDLRGKIVVAIYGAPSNIPGPLRAHFQSAAERKPFLERAGVVGGVGIIPPKQLEIPWSRLALSRFMPAMSLADPQLTDAGSMKLAVTVNPAHAALWFEGSGHTFEELLALADAGKPLPRFPLKGVLRARARLERTEVESQNVAAILPGSDPVLKHEHVVLSAHLDHVGIGKPIDGDSIYNGAMDNASGVSTLLEIARLIRESGKTPRRSILFVAVTGEEKGLLGSKYFAAHPAVPVSSMAADINFDMFLPLYPLRAVTVFGLNESDLGDTVRTVAAPLGIGVEDDPEPDRNLFVRSDQYSFIRRGVPSLSFGFAHRKGSSEEQAIKEWLTKRYHAPSDDLKQPIDLRAADRFNHLMWKLVDSVANADKRPRWKDQSFFKRFAG